MTEYGLHDDWPKVYEKVAADILIIGTPIWLGERSSVCTRVIERLYAQSGQLNEKGQYSFYGKVGGCIVTGNEDGIKHVAMGCSQSPASGLTIRLRQMLADRGGSRGELR